MKKIIFLLLFLVFLVSRSHSSNQSDIIESITFENNLEYFEIAYSDAENLPLDNQLLNFSIGEKKC